VGTDVDLAVIGAGPGGCACALAAARLGLSVALFDPREGPEDRPCGEGILPEGVAALESLGLGDLVASGRRFSELRFFLRGREALEVRLPSPATAIPRPDLLRALDAALDGRVERVRTRATEGSVRAAKALVFATGGSSRSGGAGRERTRIGWRARFEAAGDLDGVEVHFADGVEAYLTPLPANQVNAAVLLSEMPAGIRGGSELFAWALDRLPAARSRLGALVTRPEGRAIPRARSQRPVRKGAFLVGDCGGGIDPILGCGVAVALRTGILAAGAAAAKIAGENPRLVESRYSSAWKRVVLPRRRLASLLLFLSRHAGAAARISTLLRRWPLLAERLASIAGGTSRSSDSAILQPLRR
jgi:flavin-dependent dehydrogenase